jgi:alkylation response protein AidB-like acyl-CoA dehydrogenase
MDLRLSEEQEMLADLVRRVCEDHGATSAVREAEASACGFSRPLWGALVEQGVCGVQIDARFGGLGLGALETAVIYEELGLAGASTPHFVSCILAANLIAMAGDEEQKQQWLPAIAAGEARLSVASLEPDGGFGRRGVRLTAQRQGGEIVLSGRKHFVPFGMGADRLLVLARLGDGEGGPVVAVIVDPAAAGVTTERQRDLAGEPHLAMSFDGARAPASDVLGGGEAVWPHWRAAMFDALIPLAAQAVGAASRAHGMSVAYAKERVAFGRPIGGFQAIAHDLAEGVVAIQGARTLTRQAAWARGAGRPFERLAAMAKHQACEVFRRISALAIQVHGGLGYTNDCDAQLYYRRAKQWQVLNWDSGLLEDEIAALTLTRSSAEAAYV